MSARFKQPKQAKDPAYLAAIHDLPCCVCEAFDMVQESPTEAHHTICGRFSGVRTPDRQAIPICRCHHTGMAFNRDKRKLAIHQGKEEWVRRYGRDTGYIAATQDKILS